jgi:hypothetical protein
MRSRACAEGFREVPTAVIVESRRLRRALLALSGSILFMLVLGSLLLIGLALLFRLSELEPYPPAFFVAAYVADCIQAFLGGIVCARIAPQRGAVTALAFVVLVTGLLGAFLVARWEPAPIPPWMLWSEPGAGAAALLLGGTLALRRHSAEPPPAPAAGAQQAP